MSSTLRKLSPTHQIPVLAVQSWPWKEMNLEEQKEVCNAPQCTVQDVHGEHLLRLSSQLRPGSGSPRRGAWAGRTPSVQAAASAHKAGVLLCLSWAAGVEQLQCKSWCTWQQINALISSKSVFVHQVKEGLKRFSAWIYQCGLEIFT